MTLYAKTDCPLCTVVKTKLVAHDIDFTICMDEKKMEELNIDRLPVVQLDNGELLEFSDIINRLKEKGDLL
jgi:glutaredoxin